MEFSDKAILLYIFEILLCFVTSIFFVQKGKLFRVFPFFFILAFFVELTCFYYRKSNLNNWPIYNWWFPSEFVFFTFWINSYIIHSRTKQIVSFSSLAYLILVVFSNIFFYDLSRFTTMNFAFGVTLLLFVIFFKLSEILQTEEIINPLLLPIFWPLSGMMISNLISIFHLLSNNYLYKNNKELLSALRKINILMSCLLYFTFIVYFLIQWKKQRQAI